MRRRPLSSPTTAPAIQAASSAPRGWHCFGAYGSDGSVLYVTPGSDCVRRRVGRSLGCGLRAGRGGLVELRRHLGAVHRRSGDRADLPCPSQLRPIGDRRGDRAGQRLSVGPVPNRPQRGPRRQRRRMQTPAGAAWPRGHVQPADCRRRDRWGGCAARRPHPTWRFWRCGCRPTPRRWLRRWSPRSSWRPPGRRQPQWQPPPKTRAHRWPRCAPSTPRSDGAMVRPPRRWSSHRSAAATTRRPRSRVSTAASPGRCDYWTSSRPSSPRHLGHLRLHGGRRSRLQRRGDGADNPAGRPRADLRDRGQRLLIQPRGRRATGLLSKAHDRAQRPHAAAPLRGPRRLDRQPRDRDQRLQGLRPRP